MFVSAAKNVLGNIFFCVLRKNQLLVGLKINEGKEEEEKRLRPLQLSNFHHAFILTRPLATIPFRE